MNKREVHMSLLDCIISIPDHLKDIVDNYDGIKKELEDHFKDQKIEKIVFVGSGTSLNASKVTRYFAKDECGFDVRCFYPNDFVNYTNYEDPCTLYVFVSQGGATKLVYEALEKVKMANLLHCTITESLDAPIAKASYLAFEMGSVNEPYMYRTIGYSCSVVTCWMIELALAQIINGITDEKAEVYKNDLLKAVDNLRNIVDMADLWYAKHKFSLHRHGKAIFGGAQCFFEVSNEADLKMMEMVPMFTRSFELEELIHGPQNAFDADTLYFILTDKNYDKDKAIHIAEFLKNEIGFCAMVGDNTLDERDLKIEFASNYFKAIEEITPFQVIAYHMATDRGRDLKRGVNSIMSKYITKTL